MIELSFKDWLLMLNPNTRIRFTYPKGCIYDGIKTDGLNFNMTLVGLNIEGVECIFGNTQAGGGFYLLLTSCR